MKFNPEYGYKFGFTLVVGYGRLLVRIDYIDQSRQDLYKLT